MRRTTAVFAVLVAGALANAADFTGDVGRGVVAAARQREALVPRLRSVPLVERLQDGPLAHAPLFVISDTSELAVWLRYALYPRRIVDVPTGESGRLLLMLPGGHSALILALDAAGATEALLAAARERVSAQLEGLDVRVVGPPASGLQLFQVLK